VTSQTLMSYIKMLCRPWNWSKRDSGVST